MNPEEVKESAIRSFKEQCDPETSQYECFFHYTDELLYSAGFEQGNKESKSLVYDIIYQMADEIMKDFDPCEINGDKCVAGENKCCTDCEHFDENIEDKCKIECLLCRVFACESMIDKHPIQYTQLRTLMYLASRLKLLAYRSNKETALNSGVTIEEILGK